MLSRLLSIFGVWFHLYSMCTQLHFFSKKHFSYYNHYKNASENVKISDVTPLFSVLITKKSTETNKKTVRNSIFW